MESEATHPNNYVSMILGGEIRIKHVTSELAEKLATLGGRKRIIGNETVWILDANNDETLAGLLSQLRDFGVSFAGGPAGWPPGEIFDHLREKGLITGKFQEIVWHGPNRWFKRMR